MFGYGGRPRTAAALGALVAAVALTVSCSSSSPGPAQVPAPSPSASTASAAPSSDPAPSEEPSPEPSPRPVTIAMAGDVHFEGVLRDRLADPATALAPATAALAAADLAVVNLETSVGRGGRPEPGKRYPFQAAPAALAALAEAGIDVAGQANNHALDFGRAPLPDLFEAVEAAGAGDPPLAVVGIGRDAEEAFGPVVTDVRGTRVAVLAATTADADPTADPTGQWAATAGSAGTADAMDPARLLRAVRAADRAADVVVAFLHWGIQGDRCPSAQQRGLAADLVAAGADVVAGSHAHVLQGDGRLDGAYVAYGLGNFAWYTPGDLTGTLTLTVRPGTDRASVTRARWTPARIGADGLPTPLTGPERAPFDDALAAARACSGLDRSD